MILDMSSPVGQVYERAVGKAAFRLFGDVVSRMCAQDDVDLACITYGGQLQGFLRAARSRDSAWVAVVDPAVDDRWALLVHKVGAEAIAQLRSTSVIYPYGAALSEHVTLCTRDGLRPDADVAQPSPYPIAAWKERRLRLHPAGGSLNGLVAELLPCDPLVLEVYLQACELRSEIASRSVA